MSKHIYQFYCEYCGFKKHTDGTDDKLYEYKTSSIQKSFLEESKPQKQNKKFRCPKCGRAITPKILMKKPIKKLESISENQEDLVQDIISKIDKLRK